MFYIFIPFYVDCSSLPDERSLSSDALDRKTCNGGRIVRPETAATVTDNETKNNFIDVDVRRERPKTRNGSDI